MVNKNYKEGDWFAVPLNPRGFAVGLAARNTTRGAIVLAYFFGHRFDSPPELSELSSLRPEDAIKTLKVGDLGIIEKKWPLIGRFPDWDRSTWPMPSFVRREPVTKLIWLVTYSDKNPNLVVSEKLITDEEAFGLETDGLYGYGAAEKVLSNLLT